MREGREGALPVPGRIEIQVPSEGRFLLMGCREQPGLITDGRGIVIALLVGMQFRLSLASLSAITHEQ